MSFCADWPLERVLAALDQHGPSHYPQCRCGAVPADDCWQREALEARRAELEDR